MRFFNGSSIQTLTLKDKDHPGKKPIIKNSEICRSSICKENTGKSSRCRKLFIVAFQVL